MTTLTLTTNYKNTTPFSFYFVEPGTGVGTNIKKPTESVVPYTVTKSAG